MLLLLFLPCQTQFYPSFPVAPSLSPFLFFFWRFLFNKLLSPNQVDTSLVFFRVHYYEKGVKVYDLYKYVGTEFFALRCNRKKRDLVGLIQRGKATSKPVPFWSTQLFIVL
ncbi:hypothetical protein SAY87_028865 [Trapa incisa]|uniref:Uncharacterized protein n=1 Tax=Trapa incisa TaxID=236973 RepID=A0AAN7KVI9_9MYRT|nr:hypothetical protein SAY87_028865 [Trapa incisa]